MRFHELNSLCHERIRFFWILDDFAGCAYCYLSKKHPTQTRQICFNHFGFFVKNKKVIRDYSISLQKCIANMHCKSSENSTLQIAYETRKILNFSLSLLFPLT
jgi:hypothetical protein